MLLVRWVVDSDWDQDEEDEKGPDDFNEQLDLQKQETKRTRRLIKQDLDRQEAKTEGKRRTTNTTQIKILGVLRSSEGNLADFSGVGRVCRQLPGVKSNPAMRLGEWCGLITADRSRQKECFCGGLEDFAHLLHPTPLRLNRLSRP